jgi:Ca2+-binding EF-hand superfamily protein
MKFYIFLAFQILVIPIGVVAQKNVQGRTAATEVAASQTPSKSLETATGTVAQPQDLPRSNYIQLMDAEFRRKDTDGDGTVTRMELQLFERKEAASKAIANNRSTFSRLDVDRNGFISPEEFLALAANPSVPDVWIKMQRFDLNRDEAITIVEYRTATLVNFDRLDIDKDGVITNSELTSSEKSTESNPSSR